MEGKGGYGDIVGAAGHHGGAKRRKRGKEGEGKGGRGEAEAPVSNLKMHSNKECSCTNAPRWPQSDAFIKLTLPSNDHSY